MRKIIYYVATSLDGYIAGPEEDINDFQHTGTGVDKYLADLKDFDTVIMGRATYEFGYKFGMKPGDAPYPHMQHYIFSNQLRLEQAAEQVKVCPLNIELIRKLKSEEGTDIYLCGGGIFASWLLNHGLIDQVKIKLNPLVLGGGTKLFADTKKAHQLLLQQHEAYEGGLQILTYEVQYVSTEPNSSSHGL